MTHPPKQEQPSSPFLFAVLRRPQDRRHFGRPKETKRVEKKAFSGFFRSFRPIGQVSPKPAPPQSVPPASVAPSVSDDLGREWVSEPVPRTYGCRVIADAENWRRGIREACLIAEALNPETPQKLRVLIHKEFLSYVRPRQKATEIERVENNSVNVLVNWGVGQGAHTALGSVKEREAIEVSSGEEATWPSENTR